MLLPPKLKDKVASWATVLSAWAAAAFVWSIGFGALYLIG